MGSKTQTITIPETNQTLRVAVTAPAAGRVRIAMNGEAAEYDACEMHSVALSHPEEHVRRFWRQIVDLAQTAEASRVDREERSQAEGRRARVSACAGHHAIGSSDRPFFGPVSRDENPAAHGGITVAEECRCGAQRLTNVNGRHEERGDWH